MLGSPVIDEAGVLGQVTRVYLQSSEVTLLTDRDAAIPVLNTRTGARSVAFGAPAHGGGRSRCASWPATPTCRSATCCTTCGVDGVYPPGLPVAKVAEVDRKRRLRLRPHRPARRRRSADGVRHVLVLEPIGDAAAAAAGGGRVRSRRRAKGRGEEGGRSK